jgi:hypothetical protein
MGYLVREERSHVRSLARITNEQVALRCGSMLMDYRLPVKQKSKDIHRRVLSAPPEMNSAGR